MSRDWQRNPVARSTLITQIQVRDDTRIDDHVFTIDFPAKTFSFGALVGAVFCFLLAYLTLLPLIAATHPQMPRTFFVGLGGTSLVWGSYLLYVVLDHRTRAEIDLKSRELTEVRRRFGVLQTKKTSLSPDAFLTEEVNSRHMKSSGSAEYESRTVYQIELKNGSSVWKLYDGFHQSESQQIVDFFGEHDVSCVQKSTSPNKWGIIGTILFMGILMLELYLKGALG